MEGGGGGGGEGGEGGRGGEVDMRTKKRGSSVVRHLPLVLEVQGSIPASGEKNFGVQTRFL